MRWCTSSPGHGVRVAVPGCTRVLGVDPEPHGYLKFDLPELAAGQVVTGAPLRVHTTTSSCAGTVDDLTVQVADNGWSETTVTWNTQPPADRADPWHH